MYSGLLGYDCKMFTCSNVQNHFPQTVHGCSSSFQPLSETLGFISPSLLQCVIAPFHRGEMLRCAVLVNELVVTRGSDGSRSLRKVTGEQTTGATPWSKFTGSGGGDQRTVGHCSVTVTFEGSLDFHFIKKHRKEDLSGESAESL